MLTALLKQVWFLVYLRVECVIYYLSLKTGFFSQIGPCLLSEDAEIWKIGVVI